MVPIGYANVMLTHLILELQCKTFIQYIDYLYHIMRLWIGLGGHTFVWEM